MAKSESNVRFIVLSHRSLSSAQLAVISSRILIIKIISYELHATWLHLSLCCCVNALTMTKTANFCTKSILCLRSRLWWTSLHGKSLKHKYTVCGKYYNTVLPHKTDHGHRAFKQFFAAAFFFHYHATSYHIRVCIRWTKAVDSDWMWFKKFLCMKITFHL